MCVTLLFILQGQGACSYMVRVVAVVNEQTQTGTRGDTYLKDNLVEKAAHGNNLIQAQDNAIGLVNPPQPVENEGNGNNLVQAKDNNGNVSVNPPQPVEKEAHGNILIQGEYNNANRANGSSNPTRSDDEWPFDVVNNEIVFTAQTMPSAEVHQASSSIECQTIAMGKTPTKSLTPPYGTNSPSDPCSKNRVSPTGRILEACGELMISFCSGLCAS